MNFIRCTYKLCDIFIWIFKIITKESVDIFKKTNYYLVVRINIKNILTFIKLVRINYRFIYHKDLSGGAKNIIYIQ
jgi:hypothetical protein